MLRINRILTSLKRLEFDKIMSRLIKIRLVILKWRDYWAKWLEFDKKWLDYQSKWLVYQQKWRDSHKTPAVHRISTQKQS
ncbi:hypothetical protein [Ureibacillus aquaedulcis]|uniref:Group II intron maturase n=1 Tax=Ureibacillus aquaedulcis TaxID=3058421 RepID=A0ABT8GSB7_9BACL|nr:hypothetical protein [Ureibacillus sp. BA0131]MDN4494289.1 hypothetical protein [Ureibacillus sp. BA0131]